MLLLKANPDEFTWNLRDLLLLSLVCHPTTLLSSQTGPCSCVLLFPTPSIATGQVPKLLNIAVLLTD
jgi:hypothetical protein